MNNQIMGIVFQHWQANTIVNTIQSVYTGAHKWKPEYGIKWNGKINESKKESINVKS